MLVIEKMSRGNLTKLNFPISAIQATCELLAQSVQLCSDLSQRDNFFFWDFDHDLDPMDL